MEAGREMDALVAEKAMGCKPYSYAWNVLRCPCPGGPHEDTDDEGSIAWLKEYSTDIAAAWSVLTKIDGQWTIEGQEGIGWEVRLSEASMREDRYENPFKAAAETAPHAICLAALKAVGVEV